MESNENSKEAASNTLSERLQKAVVDEKDAVVSDLLEGVGSSSGWADSIRENGIEVDQTLSGILPGTSTVTVICGPSTVGKSFLALDLVARIASRTNFAGKPFELGGSFALYVAAEDHNGIVDRAAAWSIAGRGGPVDRVVLMNAGSIRLPKDTAPLIATIEKVSRIIERGKYGYGRCGLIVVDHLTALAGGDSLDTDGIAEGLMRSLHNIAGNFYCPVVAIHHTGRDGTRFRGSQVIFDRCDAFWSVRLGKADERIVRIDKMRNGPKSPGFRFRLDPAEVTVWEDDPEAMKLNTLFVEHLGEISDGNDTDRKPLSRRAEETIAALPANAITEGLAREFLEKAGIVAGKPDAKRMAFKRIIAELQEAGLLTRANGLIQIASAASSGAVGGGGEQRTTNTL